MEPVGSQLRQARLSRALTLEEIHAKTRISLRNLKALESDDLSGMSSPFFYRSYVKQVAEQVELNYESLAEAVERAAQAIPAPLIPGEVPAGHTETPAPKIGRLRPRRHLNLRWLYSLVSFAVMLVACSSFYGAWQQSRSNWRGQLSALVNSFRPASRTTRVEVMQQSVAPFGSVISSAVTRSEVNSHSARRTAASHPERRMDSAVSTAER